MCLLGYACIARPAPCGIAAGVTGLSFKPVTMQTVYIQRDNANSDGLKGFSGKKMRNAHAHDDYGYSLQDCPTRIYHSKLYKKLSLERTKYWHLGPVDLYEELKKEL